MADGNVNPNPNPNPNPAPAAPTTPSPTPAPDDKRAAEEAAYWKGVAEGQMRSIPQSGSPVSGSVPQTPTPTPTPPPEPADPGPEPRFDDFKTPGEFEDARTKWLDKKSEYRTHQVTKQEGERAARQVALDRFNQRLQSASVADPEIFAIKDRLGMRISPAIASAIIGSDMAPRLLRYLNDNPMEVGRLNSMDPTSAIREMGRIEQKMEVGGTTPPGSPPTTPTPAPTNAPNPLSPSQTVGGSGSSPVDVDPGDPDSDKLSIDDWMAKRQRQRMAVRAVRAA